MEQAFGMQRMQGNLDTARGGTVDLFLYPDPILRVRTQDVLEIDDVVAERVEAMIALMCGAHGIGLAAPQVGWNARLFVTNPDPEKGGPRVYVNPEILEWSGREVREEGCLSLPGVLGKILRPSEVRVKAYDLEGQEIVEPLTGLAARVFQHEHDHLEGILIIDRMSHAERVKVRRDLKALEEKYEPSTRSS